MTLFRASIFELPISVNTRYRGRNLPSLLPSGLHFHSWFSRTLTSNIAFIPRMLCYFLSTSQGSILHNQHHAGLPRGNYSLAGPVEFQRTRRKYVNFTHVFYRLTLTKSVHLKTEAILTQKDRI